MDAFRPQQRLNLIARVVCGEVVVLDPENRLIHELNATASFIWNLCRGQADPATIAAELSSAYDVDLESATRDVTRTLAQFDELRLLDTSETSDPVRTDSPP